MIHNREAENQQAALDLSSGDVTQKPGVKSGKQYVKPAVLTHSGDEVLDELGPAQACYPFSSCGVTP